MHQHSEASWAGAGYLASVKSFIPVIWALARNGENRWNSGFCQSIRPVVSSSPCRISVVLQSCMIDSDTYSMIVDWVDEKV